MKYSGGLIGFVLLCVHLCPAQTISLDRQVISCFGLSGGGLAHFSMTAGETAIQTYSTPGFELTQGFHQPSDVEPEDLEVLYEISFLECDEVYEIQLLTVTGCNAVNGYTVSWEGTTGDSLFTFQNSLLSFTIITSDCEIDFTLDISTEEVSFVPCPLLFYSLITPNGDGANDDWIIENIDFHTQGKNEVNIYNRRGELIWSGKGYDNHNVLWTGNSDNGNPLPDGTYFYSVITDAHTYQGYVELHR